MTKAFDRCQLENHGAFQKFFMTGNPKSFVFLQKVKGKPSKSCWSEKDGCCIKLKLLVLKYLENHFRLRHYQNYLSHRVKGYVHLWCKLPDANVRTTWIVKVLPLITSIEVTLQDWIQRIHRQSEKRKFARTHIFNSCFFPYKAKIWMDRTACEKFQDNL